MSSSFQSCAYEGKKMKRFMKECMAVLLAGTMMLGISVSVFAAEKSTVSVTTEDTASKVKKTWNVAENGLFIDNEEFKFTLNYENADPIGTNETVQPKLGRDDFLTKQVVITTTWKANAEGGESISAEIGYEKLFEDITFSAPGIYHFELKEEEGKNPNISYSKTSYDIDVQVIWDKIEEGTLKIGGIVTKKRSQDVTSDTEKKVPDAIFVNEPAEHRDLTISKTVAGNAANKNDIFTFTVLLDPNTTSGTYSTNYEKVTVTAGQEATFTLKHGEKLIIHNLPIHAKYTVTEKDSKGYEKTEIAINRDAKKTGKVAEATIIPDCNTVAYTNTNNVASPTGMILQYVPNVLLLVVAVIGCFIFFRRRRG